LFAVALLALQDAALRTRLDAYRAEQTALAQSMALPPLATGNGA
jgi:5-(carboxyamino)imidazole ribonucleotide mutase